jgi:thiamine-phosphate pyrophosphorylase
VKLPRFYPIIDVDWWRRRGHSPVEAARAALAGGAGILQWRSKGPLTRMGLQEAERTAAHCRDAGATFIVNDRADVAMLLGAGLHLGQDDLPAADGRKLIGDGAVLGFSTHNDAQLSEAEASAVKVDYLAVGPIFGTSSKENPDPVVGCARLREWRPLTSRPLVAIGGITRGRAREVLEAGADSVAVIGDLIPDPCTLSGLSRRVEEWLELVKE